MTVKTENREKMLVRILLAANQKREFYIKAIEACGAEAVENYERPYMIGVQWQPEMMLDAVDTVDGIAFCKMVRGIWQRREIIAPMRIV